MNYGRGCRRPSNKGPGSAQIRVYGGEGEGRPLRRSDGPSGRVRPLPHLRSGGRAHGEHTILGLSDHRDLSRAAVRYRRRGHGPGGPPTHSLDGRSPRHQRAAFHPRLRHCGDCLARVAAARALDLETIACRPGSRGHSPPRVVMAGVPAGLSGPTSQRDHGRGRSAL